MSRAANCYDNAFMESCFGTIKTELEMTEYEHSRQARSEIASYLAYYNTERLHSSLEYLSPTDFEVRLTQNRLATRLSGICQAAQGKVASSLAIGAVGEKMGVVTRLVPIALRCRWPQF
jgi:hypothetical protein